MFRNFFVIVILISVCLVIYGAINLFLEVEQNACRMTYMFGQPQFSRVNFVENAKFPNYGLYYYYEGTIIRNVNQLKLTGAPVIFVPGNGGSLKQVRSLASVALRKSMDSSTNVNLDYFTVDFNEELSGFYGEYLREQAHFLAISIKAVLSLYNDKYAHQRKVVLIGHSMGGKIAQSLLTDSELANKINSVIFISSPLDIPVINLDIGTHNFYRDTNAAMSNLRSYNIPNNNTNFCCNELNRKTQSFNDSSELVSKNLDNVLLISIGGGNRDFLVREALTNSKYSDVHAITSRIPKVWLSCDHLSSVWCLQLMMVVNRFLFEISIVEKNRLTMFNENKDARLRIANKHFGVLKFVSRQRPQEVNLNKNAKKETFKENSRKVFSKNFPHGFKNAHNELLKLHNHVNHRKLHIDLYNYDDNDWLYGCSFADNNVSAAYGCYKAQNLGHYIEQIPSKVSRYIAQIDLHNIRKTYTNWTHLVIRIPPTTKPVLLNVDIHEPSERYLDIAAPRWFSLKKNILINETIHGTIRYKIRISGLQDSFHGMELNIEPTACTQKSYSLTTRTCVPWALGFDTYKVLSENAMIHRVFVNVPMSSPVGYNTTENPITVDMFLDPVCRYSISYKFSIDYTMSRIIKEFYSWLPAHFVAVLIIVLQNQLGKFSKQGSLKTLKPYTGFFQYGSIYILTGCRLLKKILMPVRFLTLTSDSSDPINSFIVAVFVHSTAIVLSIMAAFGIWGITMSNSSILHKVMMRLTRISFTQSSILLKILNQLPLTFGVVTVSIAYASCSGVALLVACVYYFITLSGAYKDYLEDWVWKKATGFLKRRKTNKTDEISEENNELVLKDNNVNENRENVAKSEEICEGLDHFPYHFAIFLLLLVIAALNVPMVIAWTRNRRTTITLPDSASITTISILCSVTILHQLQAPNNLSMYKIVAILLYGAASASVLYCQHEIFRLNYVVAFVFGVLAIHELIGSVLRRFK